MEDNDQSQQFEIRTGKEKFARRQFFHTDLIFFVKSFKFSAIKTFQLQFVPILACISYLNLFDFRIESTTVEDKSAKHGWEKINN